MNKVIIIAEAGVNHNGNMETAKKLIDAAALAGVDYVKFQTFKAEKIASKAASKAAYQQENTGGDGGQIAMLKKLELDKEDHLFLIDYCKTKNIAFLSTPFDLDSITLLADLGIQIGKIPSGEITNLPYLRKMAATFPELIMSTGMSTMEEIKNALAVVLQAGAKKEKITILHCNTQYPTPMQDVNLLAMNTIGKELDVRIGYSDHTLGIEVPVAAVALGATMIEKHFTLDKNMEGPDHKASLEPHELTAMTSAIRNISQALGQEDKLMSPSEAGNLQAVRKSIVAGKTIRKGDVFTAENLAVKRPGTGISPMEWDNVLGKTAARDFNEDEIITL